MTAFPNGVLDDIKEAAWHTLPVPLAWLAEMDAGPPPEGLPGAFGDCYLCRNNPVYASLRRATLDYGYTFSSEDNNLWRDYQAMSLGTLQRILETKTIPYLDTSETVRRLLLSRPTVSMPPGLIVSNIRHNYTFHESAHCVAYSALGELRNDTAASPGREHFVEEAILAESFANTVEMLGSLVRERPLSDTVFYGLNSYVLPKTHVIEALTDANSEFGPRGRFSLLFISFFEVNLCTTGSADLDAYDRIRAAWGTQDRTPVAEKIMEIGFGLSKRFRAGTTPTWFEMLGYKKEYELVKNAQWLREPRNRDFLAAVIQRFWELAGNP